VVASVADLGYGDTGVGEISEISGVSTRSFYNLFPGGKEECFLVVLDAILKRTTAALSAAGEEEEGWEDRLRAIYQRFAEMVAAQPATASLVLTEAYAAGPAATEALDRATGAFERLSRRRLEESPERAGLPAAMIQAQVGALQELARTKLRGGEAAALPKLVPDLVDLASGYRPPPTRLRLGARRPPIEADGLTSSDEAGRAIRGFTLAVAEHGYAGATIHEIARLGSMSPNTFYANFRDKREALLAAIDTSTGQMQALAMAAYRWSLGWTTGVRAAIASALAFLAARPATAKLLLAEAYAGGDEALRVRAAGLGELRGILEERLRRSPDVPAVAPDAIIGGIVALARRQLLRKGAESLPSLTPIATYIALAPYVGAEEACLVASGDTREQDPTTGKRAESIIERVRGTRWVIHGLLATRWATAEEVGEEISAPAEEVLASLEELEELGVVERTAPKQAGGSPRWSNLKRHRLLDGEEWEALSERERNELVTGAIEMMVTDMNDALRRRRLGIRLDEHYTRLDFVVDQEAWTEIADIHRAAFHATEVVRELGERRLRKSGEDGIQGRSLQSLFELSEEA
jgi:AcrR family transcriptional regulator